MGQKKDDPDSTLPGKSFGHVELEIGSDMSIGGRPFHGARAEDATQVSERTRAAVGDPRVAAMRELYAEGDANGALFIALSIAPSACAELEDAASHDGWGQARTDASLTGDDDLTRRPGAAASHVPAWRRSPRRFVPRVLRSNDEIASMPIDHRGGFLLAHVDGVQTVDELLDVCAMPEDEAVRLIEQLVAIGAIALVPNEYTPTPISRRLR